MHVQQSWNFGKKQDKMLRITYYLSIIEQSNMLKRYKTHLFAKHKTSRALHNVEIHLEA